MALENTELDDLIAAKVKEALEAAVKTPEDKQEVVKGPVTVNILGKKYEYASEEERDKALSETFEKANAEFQALRSQIPQNTEKKEGSYVTGKEEPTFSQEHYIELMGKGPNGIKDAFNYALNHAVFEGKSANAAQDLRESIQKAKTLDSTVAVYQFRERHPEFQLTPENTKKIDDLRNELGQGFNLSGLEAAYGVGQSRGLFVSPQLLAYQQEQEKLKTQKQAPVQDSLQTWQQAPPPSIGRNVQQGTSTLADIAEDLTFEQLEKALRKAGQL